MKDQKSITKQKLMELTADFCREHIDQEYAQLSKAMIEKLGRKKTVPFLRGRVEIWAAAIVHCVGSLNFLFDKSFKPFVSIDQLADYFGVSKSTLTQKSRLIRETLKLNHWDPEFSTQRMRDQSPFNNLEVVTINGMQLIVPKANLDELFGV